MATYTATVRWNRGADEAFTDNKYNRVHLWDFDGGATVRASSSPHVVPKYSDPKAVDPEEAFIASLSSCHMLTFLYVAAKKGFIVESYEDAATGAMAKNGKGRFWVSTVTLHPKIVFGGAKQPTSEELDQMHHAAHDECFIANSVLTDVRCEPVT